MRPSLFRQAATRRARPRQLEDLHGGVADRPWRQGADAVPVDQLGDELRVEPAVVAVRELDEVGLERGPLSLSCPSSSKKRSMPPGEMNSTVTAGSSMGFHSACSTPRGRNRNSPASTTASRSPTRAPIRPCCTKLNSSSRAWVCGTIRLRGPTSPVSTVNRPSVWSDPMTQRTAVPAIGSPSSRPVTSEP